MAQTLEDSFKSSTYRPSGFDYLRLSLALAVIFWHGSVVVYGHEFDGQLAETWVGALSRLVLPMFFALSGFLVAGSLFRTNSLVEYASFRALRIFPALAVEVTLSAFILGALITALPLGEYFTSTEFFRYLANMLGIIYVYLPGVFQENNTTWVNISLWTVPYELECYLILLGMALIGIFRRPLLFALGFLAIQVAIPLLDVLAVDHFEEVNRVPPRTLILCFIAGIGVYYFRERLPLSWPLAIAAVIACFFMVQGGVWTYFIPIPIAYFTVVIGLTNPPKIPVIFSGDYSYGMYLYAFPFQQLHIYLFPNNESWFANMAFAIPATALFACFSWWMIEKPILKRRKDLVAGLTSWFSARMGKKNT